MNPLLVCRHVWKRQACSTAKHVGDASPARHRASSLPGTAITSIAHRCEHAQESTSSRSQGHPGRWNENAISARVAGHLFPEFYAWHGVFCDGSCASTTDKDYTVILGPRTVFGVGRKYRDCHLIRWYGFVRIPSARVTRRPS